MFDIFEQPWTLLTGAIIALLVLLIVRSISPEKRRWWQFVIPLFLAVAAFELDFLVQTDTEKINAVISAAVKAVEEEDCAAIQAIISDNYRDSFHNTKKALISHCSTQLSKPLIEKSYKTILAIDIHRPTAAAVFTARMLFDKRSYIYQSFKAQMVIKMKLELQKQPDNNWLIKRAEILELDRQPADWHHIR